MKIYKFQQKLSILRYFINEIFSNHHKILSIFALGIPHKSWKQYW